MTLNEVRKAYNKKEITIDNAINEICSYIVTLDKSKMIEVTDWIIEVNNRSVDGLTYDYFFKVIDNTLYIKVDTLEDIVSTLLKTDLEKAHKIIWIMIYKNKLNTEHGKVTFKECNKYGARYGEGEHPYCIYK